MTDLHKDLLAPPPVKLPEDPAAGSDLDSAQAIIDHPESPLAWAHRAELKLRKVQELLDPAGRQGSGNPGEDADADAAVTEAKLDAYAAARTGYHRGLDRLRGNGWKGWGPVPFDHEPNRGVLRAIAALAKAAELIGENAEAQRCSDLLKDADPQEAPQLLR